MPKLLLGDYQFHHKHLDLFDRCIESADCSLKKADLINSLFTAFIKIIHATEGPVFLLPALLHAFDLVNQKQWINVSFGMTLFEFWLNQFSGLTLDDQLSLRGKIVGKMISREAYQGFFPIGMNKYYRGTHFVAAHLSPDIDTTVASFIGWIDAFGAKVGTGQHIWNVPSGPSEPSIIPFFEKIWGRKPFEAIARTTPTLTLGAIDLLTREGMEEVKGTTSLIKIDSGLHEKAIILTDENGYFIGDWHARDAEIIRPIIFLYKALLKWFESRFYISILRFFADPEANRKKYSLIYQDTFQAKLKESAQDMTDEEKEDLSILLNCVFGVKKGLEASYEDLSEWSSFKDLVRSLENTSLFLPNGQLNEDRPLIFHTIEHLIASLNLGLQESNRKLDYLSTAVSLKSHLAKRPSLALSLNSTIEEIRTKMEEQDYLPVLIDGTYPIGIIPKKALSKMPLGTVSLRDFSNFEEMHMASYLNVISIIDHHKSTIQTTTPALVMVGDAQSCNILVAEQLFLINDVYRAGIDSEREIGEYYSCLYAIIDDTDFLSKVSTRDIDCIVKLLNRLKALIQNTNELCIDLSSLPRDASFAKKGAQLILKSPDMFSLYDKIIRTREKITEKALFDMEFELLFSDTKEQNECARIGQTKLFPDNFPRFEEQKAFIQQEWCKRALQVHQVHPDIALHLQMISTIPSSKDLFSGKAEHSTHYDELWIWVPNNSSYAEALLATFLNGMLDSPSIQDKTISIQLFNDAGTLEGVFQHNFLPLSLKSIQIANGDTFAVVYIKAGTLNSRKSMVSPYLPRKVA